MFNMFNSFILKMAKHRILHDKEGNVKILDMTAFTRWARWNGYTSIEDFNERTHISPEILINRWFQVVGNRVYVDHTVMYL